MARGRAAGYYGYAWKWINKGDALKAQRINRWKSHLQFNIM